MTALTVAIVSFLGIPTAILVWDFALYRDSIPRNSISQVVVDLSKKYPLFGVAIGIGWGFLMAHWFTGAWAI